MKTTSLKTLVLFLKIGILIAIILNIVVITAIKQVQARAIDGPEQEIQPVHDLYLA